MTRVRRPSADSLWLLLPFVVSLWVASRYASTSLLKPSMEDLMVYRRAASAILAGQDPYELTNSFPFIYPPFAALLSLLLGPMSESVMKLAWALTNVVATWALITRTGVRGWQRGVLTAAALGVLAPFTYTLMLGQLGIVLMVLCLVDVLDGDRSVGASERRARPRWLPVGVLTGLAAGIKLTPAVFIGLLWLAGRRRHALVALGTFAATVAIGLAGLFGPGIGYWGRLLKGDSGANPDAFGWLYNQSVLSGWQRFFGVQDVTGGLVLAALIVALGIAAAHRSLCQGQPWLAVGMLGMASSLANPIAWIHHLTWILPLGIGAWRVGVPVALRVLALISAVWWQWQPFARLPGAPWAHAEQHLYTVGEKFLACGGAIAVGVTLLAAVVLPWPGEDAPIERELEPRPTESASTPSGA